MKEYVSNKIIGTWKLISWVTINEQKERKNAFGNNPSGILMYADSGYMNAQLMTGIRPHFETDSLHGGTTDEIVGAYTSYACYYGKFYEDKPGELRHEVEGSLFPNWTGQDEIRLARIEGEYLYLGTPPFPVENEIIFHEVKWKRVE